MTWSDHIKSNLLPAASMIVGLIWFGAKLDKRGDITDLKVDGVKTEVSAIKQDVTGLRATQDAYHIDDVQHRQLTDDRIDALERANHVQPQGYQTQTYNPITKVRRMIK